MILTTIGVVSLLLILFFMTGYNKLTRLQALVEEGYSGIDVQLKRRYNLIPNLLATVEKYSLHEKSVLENITKFRSLAMQATDLSGKAEAESQLSGALKSLFAVAENYPDLKANQNYLELQHQLSSIEDEIQLARRYYNGATRNYNITVRVFPSNIIASMFNFRAQTYFELSSAAEREVPKIK